MTGDFAQDTSVAAQPSASSRSHPIATGSPSNRSPSRLTSSISRGMTASFPVDASGLRAQASPTIAVIPLFSFSPPRNHGATT